ncbi:MAG: hypothetical protein HQL17_03200 [Candidatus Omnitrophica bacterium]|nr:hypothetical protein [Candidatus Omnitrophota bacterium]
MSIQTLRKSTGFKCVLFVQAMAFVLSGVAMPIRSYAQSVSQLPVPGTMLAVSQPFAPLILRGFKVDPANPLLFDFIVDKGDTALNAQSLQDEGKKLIKYFLTALTVPSKDLWVNLSPYENNRIIPEQFGKTEMGQDLLGQDYILKQLTASLMHPDSTLGKDFWDRVYARAQAEFGTTQIPIDTFNKVWIMPDRAKVFEKGNNVYLVDAKMKVMLEQDYVSLENNKANFGGANEQMSDNDKYNVSKFASDIVREVLIPEITREVNEGKSFAQLRQVHYALVLAAWYERKIKDSILGKTFAGQNKILGNEGEDPQAKQKIYERYVEAFKKGAYNFIKEDTDQYTQEVVPRKYFSGGYKAQKAEVVENAQLVDKVDVTAYRDRLADIKTSLTLDHAATTDVNSRSTSSFRGVANLERIPVDDFKAVSGEKYRQYNSKDSQSIKYHEVLGRTSFEVLKDGDNVYVAKDFWNRLDQKYNNDTKRLDAIKKTLFVWAETDGNDLEKAKVAFDSMQKEGFDSAKILGVSQEQFVKSFEDQSILPDEQVSHWAENIYKMTAVQDFVGMREEKNTYFFYPIASDPEHFAHLSVHAFAGAWLGAVESDLRVQGVDRRKLIQLATQHYRFKNAKDFLSYLKSGSGKVLSALNVTEVGRDSQNIGEDDVLAYLVWKVVKSQKAATAAYGVGQDHGNLLGEKLKPEEITKIAELNEKLTDDEITRLKSSPDALWDYLSGLQDQGVPIDTTIRLTISKNLLDVFLEGGEKFKALRQDTGSKGIAVNKFFQTLGRIADQETDVNIKSVLKGIVENGRIDNPKLVEDLQRSNIEAVFLPRATREALPFESRLSSLVIPVTVLKEFSFPTSSTDIRTALQKVKDDPILKEIVMSVITRGSSVSDADIQSIISVNKNVMPDQREAYFTTVHGVLSGIKTLPRKFAEQIMDEAYLSTLVMDSKTRTAFEPQKDTVASFDVGNDYKKDRTFVLYEMLSTGEIRKDSEGTIPAGKPTMTFEKTKGSYLLAAYDSSQMNEVNNVRTDIDGGIDFDLNNVNMDIESDGRGIQFNFDPAMLNNGNYDGLVPMIRSITPIADLTGFMAK